MKKNTFTSILAKTMTAALAATLVLSVASCGSASKNGTYYDTMDEVAEASASSRDYDPMDNKVAEASESPRDFGFTNGASYESADGEVFYESETEEQSLSTDDAVTERKIIRTAWANIQTKEYDDSIASLKALCDKYGAYFENSTSYGNRLDYTTERRSEFVIRIPIANYDAFRNEVVTVGAVVESGEDNSDVTEKYFDIETRLDSAKLREERVLKILENADKLDDVLALERELADIRYEIETMTGTLRKYDSLISYATFRLSVKEVIEYTAPTTVPKTFGERMSQNFNDGLRDFGMFWQDVAIALSYNVFAIITWIVIIVIAVVIIKLCTARSRKKREEKNKLLRERAEKLNRENEIAAKKETGADKK